MQQDDMKLNDSQFRAPHTGILYTPPKWPDIDAKRLRSTTFWTVLDRTPVSKSVFQLLEPLFQRYSDHVPVCACFEGAGSLTA